MKISTFFMAFCCEVLLNVFEVRAQPQYRVVVDPPYLVSAIPSNVQPDSVFVILCFREENSRSNDTTYCPLGFDLRQANPSTNQPPRELPLMDGAENIPPEYPLLGFTAINLGVGLLVTITGIRDTVQETLATQVVPRAGGAPGTLFTRANARIGGSGSILYTIKFRVYCLPEFTGFLDCNETAPPTTAPPTTAITTTTTPATTQTPTTPEMTTATQAMTPTTNGTTTTAGAGSTSQSVIPIAAGVGVGVAVVLLTLVIVVVVVLCVLRKKKTSQKQSRGNSENGNPLYVNQATLVSHNATATVDSTYATIASDKSAKESTIYDTLSNKKNAAPPSDETVGESSTYAALMKKQATNSQKPPAPATKKKGSTKKKAGDNNTYCNYPLEEVPPASAVPESSTRDLQPQLLVYAKLDLDKPDKLGRAPSYPTTGSGGTKDNFKPKSEAAIQDVTYASVQM